MYIHPKHTLLAFQSVALCFLLLTTACVDEGNLDSQHDEPQTQTLHVTPRVEIKGLDQLNNEVFLQDLYLGVAEIRLEPITDNLDEIIYVTRTPIFLHFDLATGQSVLEAAPMTLPHGGEYLISLSLEPVEEDTPSTSDDNEPIPLPWSGKSMRLDGLLAQDINCTGGPGECEGDDDDNEPMPLPWRVGRSQDQDAYPPGTTPPIEWVPWTYSTAQSARLHLNHVSFKDTQDQTLVISIDLADWINDAIDPITAAVIDHNLNKPAGQDNRDQPRSTTQTSPVDVSENLEAQGEGIESIGAYSMVQQSCTN